MNKLRLFLLAIIVILVTVVIAACTTSQVVQESSEVNRQTQIYTETQPVSVYDSSVERSVLMSIIDARVRTSTTYTYFFPPFGNRPVFSCASYGYPIPATAQLTNPEQIVRLAGANYLDATLPQMEPTGIYAPPDADATYSACRLSNGNATPFYWEPPVVTSPIPLKWVPDEYGGHFEAASAEELPPLIDYNSTSIQFDPNELASQQQEPSSPVEDENPWAAEVP